MYVCIIYIYIHYTYVCGYISKTLDFSTIHSWKTWTKEHIFHVEIATASPPIFRQALIYKIVGYITIRSHKIFELYPNDISL